MDAHIKLMLVDDNKAYQNIFTSTFDRTKFHIILCQNGQQAIDYVKQYPVDVICSSYYLADINGIDLCKRIKAIQQQKFKPFLLMTSVASQNLVHQALPAGVTDIFAKDDFEQLMSYICRFPFPKNVIKAKVLYVEDTDSQREHGLAMLTSKNIDVDAFADAESAWQAFLDNDYDLVITDLVLAGNITGLMLTNRIRRVLGSKGDTPILAVTAFDDTTRKLELFHFGVNDYVIKPLIEEDFLFRVQSLIEKHQQHILNEKQQLANLVFQNTSEAMFVTDENNQIIGVNPAFTNITGFSAKDVFSHDPKILSSKKHNADFFQAMWHDIIEYGTWSGEIWNKRKSGEEFIAWLTINTIYDDQDHVYRRVALFNDITDKVQTDALILQQANLDSLTGLANRRFFHEYLAKSIASHHRTKQQFALLFIDLDNFKDINDSLGHGAGDQLLKMVAKRLQQRLRKSDCISRNGGDEFTLIIDEFKSRATLEQLTSDILNTLSAPYQINDNQVHVSASIGVAVYPDDGEDADALVKHADQAMYQAKESGKNAFCYFTAKMQQEAQSRIQLIKDLRTAVGEQQFELYFQPIIDCQNSVICKGEALLRWQHPILGFISPAYFIPVAEECGLIHEIGDWVFAKTARFAKKWLQYCPELQLSINKSPIQFHNEQQHLQWLNLLKEIGIDESHIVIELTENTLMTNAKHFVEQLQHYRQQGVEISIDDFGTGYSSLSYLQKFAIDYLKIDRSFIQHLTEQSNAQVLTEAMIVMAHKLGIKVIAEGVENQQQLAILKQSGCDFAQGFMISKPLPAAEFEQLICR